jgi:hypothetical protein
MNHTPWPRAVGGRRLPSRKNSAEAPCGAVTFAWLSQNLKPAAFFRFRRFSRELNALRRHIFRLRSNTLTHSYPCPRSQNRKQVNTDVERKRLSLWHDFLLDSFKSKKM